MHLHLLPLGGYLLPLTTLNWYQSMDSSGKFFFTTTSGNVSIVRYRMSLVTILVMDFVMIRLIRWIQRKSFSKNSSVSDTCWCTIDDCDHFAIFVSLLSDFYGQKLVNLKLPFNEELMPAPKWLIHTHLAGVSKPEWTANINGPIRYITIKADASDRWPLSFYWVTEHGFARISEVWQLVITSNGGNC